MGTHYLQTYFFLNKKFEVAMPKTVKCMAIFTAISFISNFLALTVVNFNFIEFFRISKMPVNGLDTDLATILKEARKLKLR